MDSKLVAKELQWVSLVNGNKLGLDIVDTSSLHRFSPAKFKQDPAAQSTRSSSKVWALAMCMLAPLLFLFPGTILVLGIPTIVGSVVGVAGHVLDIQLQGPGTCWVLAGLLATGLSGDALQQLGPPGCRCWQGWAKGVGGFL